MPKAKQRRFIPRPVHAWLLGGVLLVRLFLGLIYIDQVPVWEAYDEEGHFAYARYLAEHNRLTLPTDDPATDAIWEKFQPPLYYNVLALPLRLFDLAHYQYPALNPYLANGDAGVNWALPFYRPTPTEQETQRAMWFSRVFTLLLTTTSVITMFLAARQIWPRTRGPAWAATLLYAFWPQYLFLGSMLTNDALATALATAALWLMLALFRGQFRVRWVLALAVVVGAAIITKINTLPLLLLAGLATLWAFVRQPIWPRRTLLKALVITGPIILLALGFLLSQPFVTNQVLQLDTAKRFWENIQQPQALGLISQALDYGFRTYWASYGWGNIEAYAWSYPLWTYAAVLAIAGGLLALGRYLWRRSVADPTHIWQLLFTGLYAAATLSLALALVVAFQTINLLPGRYLLPTLPAVAILLVAGWRVWLPRVVQKPLWAALGVGLIVFGGSVPFNIIAPAYRLPTPLTVPLEHVAQPLRAVFNSEIELLGYQTQPIRPGETLQLTLCWQALQPITANYSLFLEVIGPDVQGYGRLTTYPGRGNYPTSHWEVRQPFCDQYAMPVGQAFPAPAVAQIRVQWRTEALGAGLPADDGFGHPLPENEARVPAQIIQALTTIPTPAQTARYRFGEGTWLIGYTLSPLPDRTGLQVTLHWETQTPLPKDYIVFVHLRPTRTGQAVLTGDGPPRNGAYPTHLWQPGEVVLDPHALVYPPGFTAPTTPLQLYVGLYDLANTGRLPAFDAQGQAVLNNEVLLAADVVLP